METLDVWRVEDDDGIGMYGGPDDDPYGCYLRDAIVSCGGFKGDDEAQCWLRHVAPQKDPDLHWDDSKDVGHYLFGFADLEQFKAWLFREEWREALARMGLCLNRYKVEPEFRRAGAVQAIFNLKHATLVESLPLTSIH